MVEVAEAQGDPAQVLEAAVDGLDGAVGGAHVEVGEDLAAALFDFICGDDARLIGFAEASGWPTARVAYARAALEAGAVG